jgi:hypothetical protein
MPQVFTLFAFQVNNCTIIHTSLTEQQCYKLLLLKQIISKNLDIIRPSTAGYGIGEIGYSHRQGKI